MKISVFKQKQTGVFVCIAAVVLLAAGAVVFFVARSYSHSRAGTETATGANATGQAASAFSFDPAMTNGWYAGPGSRSSLTLFGKESGLKDAAQTYFAIIDYREDGVSKDAWLQNRMDAARQYAGTYDFVTDGTVNTVLSTDSGPIAYEIHMYRNVLKTGAGPSRFGLNEAEAHGYITYGNGYIRVQGYATPAKLLPEVIEAIGSYRLETGKLRL